MQKHQLFNQDKKNVCSSRCGCSPAAATPTAPNGATTPVSASAVCPRHVRSGGGILPAIIRGQTHCHSCSCIAVPAVAAADVWFSTVATESSRRGRQACRVHHV